MAQQYPLTRAGKGTPLSSADHDNNLGFATLAALLADTQAYSAVLAGSIFTTAEGWRYEVAASGASDHHLTTAGGLKLYVLPGADGLYNFMAFNPAADGVTDDYAVLVKAIGAVLIGSGSGATGPSIWFPDGYTFYIGSTVQLKSSVRLMGSHTGLASRPGAAILKWPTNTTGLRFNRYDTLDGVVVASTNGADSSEVVGLHLTAAAVGSDKSKHGIHANCRISVKNCFIEKFSGDGIHIEADSSTSVSNPAIYGNANLSQVMMTLVQGNGNCGLFLNGYDCNVCYCFAVSAVNNGRWGIYDSSFLGNTHIAHHSAGNGLASTADNGAGESCYVSYGGNRYAAAPGATEAELVATTPGTDETVWTLIKAGGSNSNIPTWTASQAEGTYFQGGAYWTDGANSRNIILGCYSEGDQGPAQFDALDLVLGGMVGSAGITAGGLLSGVAGESLIASEFEAGTSGVTAHVGDADTATLTAFDFNYSGDGTDGIFRFQRVGNDWQLRNKNSASRVAVVLTSSATSQQMGTGAAVPYLWTMPTFGVGSGSSIRRQTTGSAAPTTGAWAAGDIVWNTAPTAGGWAGWICTTAGTPGTWKTFGEIAA